MKPNYRNVLRIIFITVKLCIVGTPVFAILKYVFGTGNIENLIEDKFAVLCCVSFFIVIGGVLFDLKVIKLRRKKYFVPSIPMVYKLCSVLSGVSFLSFGIYFIYLVITKSFIREASNMANTICFAGCVMIFIATVIFVDLFVVHNYLKSLAKPQLDKKINKIGKS